MFADQPGFVARQMLLALIPDPLRWSISDPDADCSKAGFELLSSRFASSPFATWHWPTCLRPASIDTADAGGPA